MDVNEMLDKLRLEYNRVLKERDTAQKINEEHRAKIAYLEMELDVVNDERDALRHDLQELEVECAANVANLPTRFATLPCFSCAHRKNPKYCAEECGVNWKTIPWELRGVCNDNTQPIEQVEVCPHCESENVFKNWDVNEKGYIATCQKCGRKIFLCDACHHSDDNPANKCDWAFVMNPYGGFCGNTCFRGKIKIGE